MKAEITTDVKCCARCGEDHQKVIFTKLSRPHPRHTHWAPCPKNKEPIMMRVVEMESAQSKPIEGSDDQYEVKTFLFEKQ